MNAIGKNATIITAGDCTPRPLVAAMKPSVAARLYAGATDATLITMFEMKPIAPFLSVGWSVVIKGCCASEELSIGNSPSGDCCDPAPQREPAILCGRSHG